MKEHCKINSQSSLGNLSRKFAREVFDDEYVKVEIKDIITETEKIFIQSKTFFFLL
jgi:hypothetical protein